MLLKMLSRWNICLFFATQRVIAKKMAQYFDNFGLIADMMAKIAALISGGEKHGTKYCNP